MSTEPKRHLRRFPAVPEPRPDLQSLVNSVKALRENVELLTRQRGDTLDSAATLRDLKTDAAPLVGYMPSDLYAWGSEQVPNNVQGALDRLIKGTGSTSGSVIIKVAVTISGTTVVGYGADSVSYPLPNWARVHLTGTYTSSQKILIFSSSGTADTYATGSFFAANEGGNPSGPIIYCTWNNITAGAYPTAMYPARFHLMAYEVL